jgi:hypothetical protein
VVRQLRATVVREELKQREDKKEPALERGVQTEEFIKNWLIKHNVPLTTQLGMHDGPPLKFLTGVFIATSTLKQQVPFLQEVIQADGGHMPFGKYILFSAYANSTNGVCIACDRLMHIIFARCGVTVVQLEATTVMSLSLIACCDNMYTFLGVGYDEYVSTLFLELTFAFTAPHHQKFPEYIVLCMPFLQNG